VTPVDIEAGFSDRPRCEATRREFARGPQILVTIVGRIVPLKGWNILIKAFTKVAPRHMGNRLLLVRSTVRRREAPFTKRLRGMAQDWTHGRMRGAR